ncbi:hypothetical protein RN001_002990 [Aquatica leii]|uniref:Uncharacterized protein n=1 Tax=Aquatica leii TaxID=1421715 RepID=A0AAN7PHN5_9COLE|nr:hypothetical protein RN001_002990 [Aquatica leii]
MFKITAVYFDLVVIIVTIFCGFHLLMSYMGSIEYIMGGSGLENMWSLVYAKASISHMMTGHAYSRSVRAHFLTQLAIRVMLMQQTDIEETTKREISNLQTNFMD